jgi:excisionase family DNA binding protein
MQHTSSASRPRVLDVDGVAEQLGVSRWLVYDLLNSGQLRGVRVGRLWRVPQGAIDSFLNGEAVHSLQADRTASERRTKSND